MIPPKKSERQIASGELIHIPGLASDISPTLYKGLYGSYRIEGEEGYLMFSRRPTQGGLTIAMRTNTADRMTLHVDIDTVRALIEFLGGGASPQPYEGDTNE